MPLPQDWEATFEGETLRSAVLNCPHCTLPSTFQVLAVSQEASAGKLIYYATLKCNYVRCRKNVFVITTKAHQRAQDHTDSVSILPSRVIPQAHNAIPGPVAEDWVEAQKAFEAGAPKAAAVMCRRVLYGVLLERGCREHPLHEGIQELCSKERLPAIVERWLNEIREEGHDAAHPQRALFIPSENVLEALGYTRELLRFVYIEPFELDQRLARKTGQAKAT